MQTDFVPEHLPAWMRQPRRSFDWGVLLAVTLGLIAAWSFFLEDGLPAYSDLMHSGFMTADLAEALGEGQVFARWSPHALSGYGAPIPNFVPQGAAFMAALTDQLLTGSPTSALRIVLVGALTGAAVAQYLFCRRWIGPTNALMAAGLYVFSPILGLTAPHVTGDLPGVVGMALLPIALWAASRSTKNTSRWDVSVIAIIFAVLLYVHPRIAGASAGIALLLTIPDGRGALRKLFVGLLTAWGLFAPFWLPALGELDAVRWRLTPAISRVNLRLDTLITLPRPVDPIILNPMPQYTLGVILPLFALCGLAWTFLRRRDRRFALVMAIAALASAFSALQFQAVWLTYPMTMCCAALGGLALEWRTRLPLGLRRATLPSALVVLMVASSAVWLSPLGPVVSDFSPLAQIEYEQNGFGVAVLPSGAALPSTISAGLGIERSLINSYRDPPLERIRPGTPARITPISSGTHGSTWQVSATAPSAIILSLAYFPGWEADLDGVALPLERDPATGLVRILLPPTTNGTLQVAFGTTPPRALAWGIVAAMLGILLLWLRFSGSGEPVNVPLLNIQELRLTAFALAFAGLGILATAIPGGMFNLRPAPFSGLLGTLPVTANGDPLRVLAYQLSASHAKPGDGISVTLYWSASTTPATNYGVRLILLNFDTLQALNLTAPTAPGGLPTRRWLAGYGVVDAYNLTLPDDLTPGTYQISVEAFPCDSGCELNAPLRFRDSQDVDRLAITLPSVLTVER